VEITWEPPSELSNVTAYNVMYNTDASYATGGTVTVNGFNNAIIVISNLEEYTLYIITVRAINNNGPSGNSNEALVRTYSNGK